MQGKTRCCRPRLGPNGFEHLLLADDIDSAREILAGHAERHLGRDLRQRLHQEVARAHAHLRRAEWMLDDLAFRLKLMRLISERANAGRAATHSRGGHFGRTSKLDDCRRAEALRLPAEGKPTGEVCRLLCVSRWTTARMSARAHVAKDCGD